jgi:hypothetical protein
MHDDNTVPQISRSLTRNRLSRFSQHLPPLALPVNPYPLPGEPELLPPHPQCIRPQRQAS